MGPEYAPISCIGLLMGVWIESMIEREREREREKRGRRRGQI